MTNEIQKQFVMLGAEFVTPLTMLSRKLSTCRAFLFDWDGVFNNGEKWSDDLGSSYNEVDAMGINLMRFSYWIRFGKMPFIGIVTGENNPSAFNLALRDHYDAVFFKVSHKVQVVDHINTHMGIPDHGISFMFDDVLDLSIAARCGLRLMVNRTANPLLKELARSRDYTDYITGSISGMNPVREVSELIMSITNHYTEAVERRVRFTGEYAAFLQARNEIMTRFYTATPGGIQEVSISGR
jgi:3-deoxy-D-manno-octulosonate 8-phosphate phosphatase (KDO 8-P phosphatase)